MNVYQSSDPRLITENNLHDDNRPYRYEQNIQEQQNQVTNLDHYDKNDNKTEEYMLENQNENRNESLAININENNASEYTTPESTTSAQNASQTETSATTQFVRIPTRIVSPRQNTHDSQLYSNTSPHPKNNQPTSSQNYDPFNYFFPHHRRQNFKQTFKMLPNITIILLI